ncbi:MAG: SDR family oxidoreductase [Candidatus Aminicenantes bacterium]|nr:MAG: SDR family oxidoreductase [Candidatus Aminicenantes bacterium]
MVKTGLKDKVALITGANHGIGAASSLAFAKQGAKVFLHYLRLSPEEYGGISQEEVDKATEPGRGFYFGQISQSAEKVIGAIRDEGGECESWESDLADPENVPQLFDKAEERFGQVDIVVNNAAHDRCDTFIPLSELEKDPLFLGEYPMRTITAESHNEHFAVNTRAVVLMIEEFARRHIDRKADWGRIINISTDGAYAHASNVSYGASKFAVESYSRAAACELGPYGITINVISPGAVQTGWMTPELEKAVAGDYPLRRFGKPEDIANAVIFFASDQAAWITGQVLHVGGGNRM